MALPAPTLAACAACAVLAATLAGVPARAQSYCSSEGVPQPLAVVERFISADCEACWRDGKTPRTAPRELALDWVFPTQRGDEAALSVVATRDALGRLQQLGRPMPALSDSVRSRRVAPFRATRVAHGLPFNDYLGTSIEVRRALHGPLFAWLLLVEALPAGTEGSPVERNLVRNGLQLAWGEGAPLTAEQQARLFEFRPMRIPEGAQPERLRVVGLVHDGRGRLVAAAQSRCVAEPETAR